MLRNQAGKVLARCLSLGLLLLLLLPGLALAAGQDLAGLWTGGIDIAGASLEIAVQFEQDGTGQLSGTLSIPAQGANGLPFSQIEVDGGHLTMTIDLPGGACFDGVLADDGSIQGTYTQAEQSFPFSLQRHVAEPPVIDNGLTSLQDLDEFVTEAMREWQVPGVAVAIVQNGEVVYAKGFGQRDIANRLPVTAETQFAIGSATKAFTTALLGMLVDEKQLDWDLPVKDYIPGFDLQDPLAGSRVTLRDLATHRTGLPRNDFAILYNPELTRAGIVDTLDALAPNVDFRTAWQYNNLGYVVAGYAAEQVTGQSWEELVAQRIFAPLGMDNSSLSIDELLTAGDYALPYIQEQGGPSEVDFWVLGASAPCGAINSSVLDMAEWLKFQLNQGQADGRQLLSSYQIGMMHTPQIVMTASSGDDPVQFSSYGLGWMIESYRGQYLVHHGGNVIGQSAEVALLPGENSGVVVLSNLQGTPLPSLVMYNVVDRLAGLQPLDLSGQMKQQLAAAAAAVDSSSSAQSKALTAAELQEYVGRYFHPFYGPVQISIVNGQLQASYYRTEIKLKHQNHDVFNGQLELWPVAIPFQFQRDLSGSVEQVLIGFEPANASLTFIRQVAEQALDPALGRKLAGQYSIQGAPLQIEYADDKLTMLLPGQPRYTLQPTGGTRFNLQEYAGYSVEFVLDQSSGKVTGIVINQPNGVFRGQRVSD